MTTTCTVLQQLATARRTALPDGPRARRSCHAGADQPRTPSLTESRCGVAWGGRSSSRKGRTERKPTKTTQNPTVTPPPSPPFASFKPSLLSVSQLTLTSSSPPHATSTRLQSSFCAPLSPHATSVVDSPAVAVLVALSEPPPLELLSRTRLAFSTGPVMARGGGTAGEEEERAASEEALTADSADDDGRRGSSSSASSEAASSVSYTYTPPDEWHKVAIIKTCVSADVVVAPVAASKDDKPPPRGGDDRHRASGNIPNRILPFETYRGHRSHSLTVALHMEIGLAEMEMMKERFSKLLLGEDMSGSGKGVCTALAISNAITNLCGTAVFCLFAATIFGQLWRLEPLLPEKKAMWRREMDWLLCISDHIVELVPTWQTFPDGTRLEVIDQLLCFQEILEGFRDAEFWYVDQGISAPDCDGSASFGRTFHRRDDKWWLPVPRVPHGGLCEATRRQVEHRRDCASQILKAAMAINSNALAEMDVPDSYLDSLPKNGRATLGDVIYRYITSEQFSPDCLLDCLDLSSEYQALEIANRIEASIYVWRRRGGAGKPSSRGGAKSSWGMVKDMIMDTEKRDLLAERAEGLLISLKQRFPGLTQTSLDMSKIQYNKDVGKSILESYSRVLESLASNIIARIDDLLNVDELSKQSDHLPAAAGVDVKIACKNNSSKATATVVPASGTPYATAYATPSFSPAQLSSPSKIGRALLVDRRSHHVKQGAGVKRTTTTTSTADRAGVEVVKGMLVGSAVFDIPKAIHGTRWVQTRSLAAGDLSACERADLVSRVTHHLGAQQKKASPANAAHINAACP
ncbi:hypothetical protein HU200_024324 [Digitaria exilis]|uniref:PRONE domain-containing protein n=1 Tax=Digitaria exilis TaxID=1010633 RepID=A0A835EVZ4_9POAL|nr:hypothetical protein HU200_024324 [Digitaria exilis]